MTVTNELIDLCWFAITDQLYPFRLWRKWIRRLRSWWVWRKITPEQRVALLKNGMVVRWMGVKVYGSTQIH